VQRLPALDTDEIARIDATYRARKETLLALDDLIAGLVEALGQAGILDNTYLVFTSDNGYHLGEHHISAGKGTAYDEAIRVPLVIRGPAVAPGRTSALASVIDLAPTIATWADVEFPAFVDGRSLTPVFSGQTGDWRKTVFAQLHRDNPDNDGPPAFRALRGDGFAYVEYSDGFRELYDLSTDPYELDNLATSVDPELITELSERLAVISRSAGAECRVAEDAPLPPELVAILGG
jgi:arylsulfatase A-like enzyme